MRIALVTNNRLPPREGIGRHVSEVGRRLRARGHSVTLVGRGAAFAGWRDQVVDGLHIRHYPHLPFHPLHHALDRLGLQRWLDATADDIDVAHIHLPLLPPLRVKRRLVVTVHTPMLTDTAAVSEPGFGPRLARLNARALSRGYEQWYLDRADEVITVSERVRTELREAYRTAGRPIRVIENGVDCDFFAFSGLAGRIDELLYVGRLGVRKGLFRLLAALHALGRGTCLRLAIVGEGPLEPALRERAARLGLSEQVDFVGFLDRAGIRERLTKAAVLVSPSDYEGFPLTLLEAMACGTPVVSTRTGPLTGAGELPVLTVDSTADALAEGIVRVLASPAETADRAIAARRVVEQRYSWDRVVDALEAAYADRGRLAA